VAVDGGLLESTANGEDFAEYIPVFEVPCHKQQPEWLRGTASHSYTVRNEKIRCSIHRLGSLFDFLPNLHGHSLQGLFFSPPLFTSMAHTTASRFYLDGRVCTNCFL
jgi:hypothetical protein